MISLRRAMPRFSASHSTTGSTSPDTANTLLPTSRALRLRALVLVPDHPGSNMASTNLSFCRTQALPPPTALCNRSTKAGQVS